MKPKSDETVYELEQLIQNPRAAGEFGARTFGTYASFPMAQAEAEKHFNQDSYWRIRECKTVSVSRRYQSVMKEDD